MAASIETVTARIASGLFQQAFVVDDLARARAALTGAIGCTTWTELPAASLPYTYRGRPVECSLALAFGRSGNVQVELVQPVGGEGVHVEFLERHGPGAHHLGFMVDDLATELAVAGDAGIGEAMAGEFGRLRFAYLDTYDRLGVYLELVEDPDGTMAQLMPWR